MRLQKIPLVEREGVLRWAVLKALTLLRVYRDELDKVAAAMQTGASIYDCVLLIEQDHQLNLKI